MSYTHRRFLLRLAMAGSVAAALTVPTAAQPRKFTPEKGAQTFAVREPVLRVQPGDVVETETLYGAWYERAGGEWPGEVGPFYIEGATPNDTLVVKILRLKPNRDQGQENRVAAHRK
jgi:hypothetical protein